MEEKKTKRRGAGYFMKLLADKGVRHQKEKEHRHGGFDRDSFHRAFFPRRFLTVTSVPRELLPSGNRSILAEEAPIIKFRRAEEGTERLTMIPSECTIIVLRYGGERNKKPLDRRRFTRRKWEKEDDA